MPSVSGELQKEKKGKETINIAKPIQLKYLINEFIG